MNQSQETGTKKNAITVAVFRGMPEPLIGVYDRCVANKCETILNSSSSSVHRLFDSVGVSYLEYQDDPDLLLNCNTPEDYQKLIGF